MVLFHAEKKELDWAGGCIFLAVAADPAVGSCFNLLLSVQQYV